MDITSFRDVPQINPGVDIIPKGCVRNRAQLFHLQASNVSSQSLPFNSDQEIKQEIKIQVVETKHMLFEKNDSKLSNGSDVSLLSVESQPHLEAIQVEEQKEDEKEEGKKTNVKEQVGNNTKVSVQPIPQHQQQDQPSFNHQLKNHFNVNDKNIIFLALKNTNQMNATNEGNKRFSSFYMVGKERIEEQIHRLGLLPKLDFYQSSVQSFILQSYLKPFFTLTNSFPFSIPPKKLAAFLVFRDAAFWKSAKTCFANQFKNGDEAKHVFEKAIKKHNSLYEFFKDKLFHPSLSNKQLKANLHYFMNHLLKKKSYSFFFTFTQLLIDLNLKGRIHFEKKQLLLFYSFSSIFHCCKYSIDTAKSEQPSSIPILHRFPFDHLHIVSDFKFKSSSKKEEQLESYFEMIY